MNTLLQALARDAGRLRAQRAVRLEVLRGGKRQFLFATAAPAGAEVAA